MLRKIYQFLQKIPLLNRLINHIRLLIYHWVRRISEEAIAGHLNEHLTEYSEKNRILSEKNTILSERLEYVRLELFFELMHRVKQDNGTSEDSQALEPIIHNQKAFDTAAAKDQLRLNLGCGHLPLDHYLNVDQRELPQVDIQASILNLPVKNNSVETLYSAHLVEHFTLENLRRNILPYWNGILKPNGKLHLIVPNAQAMIMAYAEQKIDFKQLSTVLMGMQEYDGDFHYALLNPDSLRKLLEEAGFQSIEFIVEARKNGLCFEMEVIVRKPKLT